MNNKRKAVDCLDPVQSKLKQPKVEGAASIPVVGQSKLEQAPSASTLVALKSLPRLESPASQIVTKELSGLKWYNQFQLLLFGVMPTDMPSDIFTIIQGYAFLTSRDLHDEAAQQYLEKHPPTQKPSGIYFDTNLLHTGVTIPPSVIPTNVWYIEPANLFLRPTDGNGWQYPDYFGDSPAGKAVWELTMAYFAKNATTNYLAKNETTKLQFMHAFLSQFIGWTSERYTNTMDALPPWYSISVIPTCPSLVSLESAHGHDDPLYYRERQSLLCEFEKTFKWAIASLLKMDFLVDVLPHALTPTYHMCDAGDASIISKVEQWLQAYNCAQMEAENALATQRAQLEKEQREKEQRQREMERTLRAIATRNANKQRYLTTKQRALAKLGRQLA